MSFHFLSHIRPSSLFLNDFEPANMPPDILHLSTQSLSFVLKWIFNFMIFFYFNIPRFTSSSCIYPPRLYFAIFLTQLHLIFVVYKQLPQFKTETLGLWSKLNTARQTTIQARRKIYFAFTLLGAEKRTLFEMQKRRFEAIQEDETEEKRDSIDDFLLRELTRKQHDLKGE